MSEDSFETRSQFIVQMMLLILLCMTVKCFRNLFLNEIGFPIFFNNFFTVGYFFEKKVEDVLRLRESACSSMYVFISVHVCV